MEELLGEIFLLPSHNHNTLIEVNVKGIVFQNLGQKMGQKGLLTNPSDLTPMKF